MRRSWILLRLAAVIALACGAPVRVQADAAEEADARASRVAEVQNSFSGPIQVVGGTLAAADNTVRRALLPPCPFTTRHFSVTRRTPIGSQSSGLAQCVRSCS